MFATVDDRLSKKNLARYFRRIAPQTPLLKARAPRKAPGKTLSTRQGLRAQSAPYWHAGDNQVLSIDLD